MSKRSSQVSVRWLVAWGLLVLCACSPHTTERPAPPARPPASALLQISAFGSQGTFPIPVTNPSSQATTIEAVTYTLTLADRDVTQGTQKLDREVLPGQDVTLNLVISLDEAWLLSAPGFTSTGALPFRLRGELDRDGAREPFDVSGVLRMRRSGAPSPR